jgi:hypothetical protein
MVNDRAVLYRIDPHRSKEAFHTLIDDWKAILVSERLPRERSRRRVSSGVKRHELSIFSAAENDHADNNHEHAGKVKGFQGFSQQ